MESTPMLPLQTDARDRHRALNTGPELHAVEIESARATTCAENILEFGTEVA